MRVLSIFVGACLAFACSAAAVAACEIEYEVQPGDTLASIAVTAYGGGSYQLIYSRNAAKIANPSAPPVGETLIIPCIAGVPGMEPDVAALSQRMGRQANVAAAAGQAAAPVVANRPQGIVILAPNDGDRYANVDLPEGGMTPAIAARALAAAGWSAEVG